jgi:signal peptidase II
MRQGGLTVVLSQLLGKQKYRILFTVPPVLVLIDQATKLLIYQRFRLGETIPVISGLMNITYVRNTGAAFGLLAQAEPMFRIPFFLLVPVAAVATIAYVFRKLPDRSPVVAGALALVLAGAIGNLIDRLRLGYVIDFLDFHWKYEHHFPAFNVADAAICVGVAVLVLHLMLHEERKDVSASVQARPDSDSHVWVPDRGGLPDGRRGDPPAG